MAVSEWHNNRTKEYHELDILVTYTAAVENLEHCSTSGCYLNKWKQTRKWILTTELQNLHVNSNKMLSGVLSAPSCFQCMCVFVCLVYGHCSGTAVHGSASQSIHVELAAHRSGLLHQRQPSAFLLHTDVRFEGNLSDNAAIIPGIRLQRLH